MRGLGSYGRTPDGFADFQAAGPTSDFVKQRYILWIGLLLYATSFFLISVVGRGPARGYFCAYLALTFPWGGSLFGPFGIFENKVPEYLAVLMSGWINLVFLITAVLALRVRSPRMVAVLRIVVVMMLPFCGVVFHYQDLYPREGYFVWIFGMLLTLFSREITQALVGLDERGEHHEPARAQ